MLDLSLSFLALTFLEIILGIDNIVFISILTTNLKKEIQHKVRIFGLALSVILRIILLFFLVWLLQLSKPLFYIYELPISLKDLIMILGGLFLMAKATTSIHSEVSPAKEKLSTHIHTVGGVIVQIAIVDVIFSLDSLITAVGITHHIPVMAGAIITSIFFMIYFANFISHFISKYKSLKMLALSFIMMIGIFLVLSGVGIDINKGYIYFAMGFSLGIETLNIYIRKKNKNT